MGQGAKFLDVGAGTCWATAILARRGMYSVALDITSEKYIGLCSADTFMKAYGIYFERVLSDMTRLPFADNSFDVVFSSAALHHSHRIERTFAEIGRVLKRNSRLVMVNETPRGIFEPRIVDIAKAKSRGWDAASSWHEFKYTSLEYVAFASKAGLSLKFFTSPEFDLILDGKLDVTASLNRVQRTLLKFLNLIFCRWEARLFRNLLFYLMLPLVRTPCIMIATKRGAPPMEY